MTHNAPHARLIQAIEKLPLLCGADLRMEDLVDPALAALPALLQDRDAWSSLYIDYEPPFLMRLAVPVECPNSGKKIHIALHYFFGNPQTDVAAAHGIQNPYQENPALLQQQSANNYHPHPWAAAFFLFHGSYNQQIGHATKTGYSDDPLSPLRPAPHAQWTQNGANPDQARYAFNDQLIWHQVLPNDGEPVASLMITYNPQDWEQTGPKPTQKQRALSDAEKDFMFDHFNRLLTAQPALTAIKKPRRAP